MSKESKHINQFYFLVNLSKRFENLVPNSIFAKRACQKLEDPDFTFQHKMLSKIEFHYRETVPCNFYLILRILEIKEGTRQKIC